MDLWLKTILFFCLCLVSSSSKEELRDLLVVYDTGNGEIRVSNVSQTIKTFKIQIKEVVGGLAVDFANDIMYFADDTQIYQIYLIDKLGRRKVSGKGKLFTDPDNEHFETILYSPGVSQQSDGSYQIKGLFFKKDTKVLYTLRTNNGSRRGPYSPYRPYRYHPNYRYDDGSESYVNEVSSNGTLINGMNSVYIRSQSPFLLPTDLIINKDGIYAKGAALSGGEPDKSYRWIYRMHREYGNYYDWTNSRYYDSYLSSPRSLVNMSSLNVSAFTIDERTNRLFFAQRSSIRVIDGSLSKNVTLAPLVKVVIADSRVTKAIRAVAVHGKLVIWSSSELKGIFVGVLNNRGTYISSKRVRIMNGTAVDDVKPRHIVIVKRWKGSASTGVLPVNVIPQVQ